MTKQIIFLALVLLGRLTFAQQNTSLHYVFADFVQGSVYYQTGAPVVARLNYNRLTHEMVFSDKGKLLAIGNVSRIDSILIMGRKFIPDKERFLEILPTAKGDLFIDRTADYIPPAANGGMGSTSQTAGQNAVRDIKLLSGIYNLSLPEFKVIPKDEIYLRLEQEYTRVNAKALEKKFPDQATRIKKLIREGKINLQKQEDLQKLFKSLNQ